MPLDLAARPLTRNEISQVLQGITDTPHELAQPNVITAAFWSTVAGLSPWCDTTDIDAVIERVSASSAAPIGA